MKYNFSILKLSHTNSFLLKTKDGYLMIDSGYEWDRDRLIKKLDKLNVRVGQITHLLLTHHHDDHCGLVNFIVEKNPRISVIMHQECVKLIRKGETDMSGGGGYINATIRFLSLVFKMLNPEWNRTFPPYTVRPADIIISREDGDELRRIGVDGSIIFTPGHSLDSIALLMDDGVLFAGDAAMNWLKWAGSHYATLFITDTEQYYASWKKILARNPRIIFPAHGSSFSPDKLKKNMDRFTNSGLVKMV